MIDKDNRDRGWSNKIICRLNAFESILKQEIWKISNEDRQDDRILPRNAFYVPLHQKW